MHEIYDPSLSNSSYKRTQKETVALSLESY